MPLFTPLGFCMATDLIRYDLLVQDALRGVVRKVLSDVARDGLQGDHHFSITFKTQTPSLRLSARMRQQYPDEMTIILQHQFWDLRVTEQAFEVGLSFQGKSELLLIPFEAVTGFYDPSVEFGLKFEFELAAAEASANDAGVPPTPATEKVPALRPAMNEKHTSEKQKPRGSASEPDEVKPAGNADARVAGPVPQGEAKIVSIDAFRKKP